MAGSAPEGAGIAGALLASLARDGLGDLPELALLRWSPAAASPVDGPEALGRLHELVVPSEERRRRGAWYTPAALAAEVVELALPDRAAADRGPVLDPACGGGAFLLAAADRLVALGWSPAEAVAALRGIDVDPLAVAVSEAALWWWSARRGQPSVPTGLAVADSLAVPWPTAGTVVGNPPFLGQLRTGTAVDAARRRALQGRFGDAVQAYTDPAWLFALEAVGSVAPGGRVALVQPQSFLAARDAGAVRARIDQHARVVATVVGGGAGFDADVSVCVPVIERTGSPGANDWTGALADVLGVPDAQLAGGRPLGDLATTHAGFRDEFYGLAPAVSEGGPGPRLVTAGAIDPLRLLDRPQRFAGRRWADPRVEVPALSGRAARWAAVQSAPKLLVSVQTRVLEAVADTDGSLLGSVPVVVVVPQDPADLWHLAAALHAPSASAWVLRRSAGTARSAGACRPTASLLAALPVPPRGPALDEAARLARLASHGGAPLTAVADAAERAYGVADPAARAWWEDRRPQR